MQTKLNKVKYINGQNKLAIYFTFSILNKLIVIISLKKIEKILCIILCETIFLL